MSPTVKAILRDVGAITVCFFAVLGVMAVFGASAGTVRALLPVLALLLLVRVGMKLAKARGESSPVDS